MQFCCLGSGSKGNTTLVSHKNTLLMVDCGFSIRHVLERMQQKNCDPATLTAILVTHEHADHINGVAALARKFSLPVYATRGTARTGKLDGVEDIRWLTLDQSITIGDVNVTPVAVPHDAVEPCQFLFEADGRKLGVVTDLGSISAHVKQAFDGCDALLLEANHDVTMLWAGNYPPSLKKRVAGDWGHLSNQQAEDFACSLNLEKLKTLVLGHISEQNNCPELVRQHFQRLEEAERTVVYATQEQGFNWLAV